MPGLYSTLQKGASYAARGIAGGSAIATAMGRSSMGTGMMVGAASGGIYGAFSSDRSMIGGAIRGAAIGTGAGMGYRLGKAGLGIRRMAGGRFRGASARYYKQELSLSARRDFSNFTRNARNSALYVGRGITNTKAYGKIRGLF